ncbi:MAG: hypothetical protein HY553_10180 [Elusimicrobia bacterium]|nr:hypothetical protein [Elusimicrobiota bacterium]
MNAVSKTLPELLLEKEEAVRQAKRVEWMTAQLLRAQRAETERDAVAQHGVVSPGHAFLEKPFTAQALLRAVRETLDSR